MFIILEGIDCAGKGLIGGLILKNLPGCHFMKHGARPIDGSEGETSRIKDTYNTMYHVYADFLDAQGKHLMVDRFYPSELVYSKPFRNYEAFDDDFYSLFETQLISARHATLVVYVHASPELLQDRMLQRGEDFLNPDQIPLILDRYATFINNTKLSVIPIRNELSIEEMTCQIKDQLIPRLKEY